MKVMAVAGAGKTTLLLSYIRNLGTERKVLVIMFNRQPADLFSKLLQDECMSDGVDVMTLSSFSRGGMPCSHVNESGVKLSCRCFAWKKKHRHQDDCFTCQQLVGKCMVKFLRSEDTVPLIQHCSGYSNGNMKAIDLCRELVRHWDILKESRDSISFDMGMKILQGNSAELASRLQVSAFKTQLGYVMSLANRIYQLRGMNTYWWMKHRTVPHVN